MSIPHIPEGADEFRVAHSLRSEDDGNTLVGYAAVFNQDTEINSWEGHFIERIAPGAFKRTLKNRGDKVKVLFNHGHDPTIGEMPLGKPKTLREDDVGLFTEVPLTDTDYNREKIKPLLRDGALDGMSFRFSVPAGGDEWDDDGDVPIRTIREAKLFELGPVVFPAYDQSSVQLRSEDPRFTALRSQMGCPKRQEQDFEEDGDSAEDTSPLEPVDTSGVSGTDPVDTPVVSGEWDEKKEAQLAALSRRQELVSRLLQKIERYG